MSFPTYTMRELLEAGVHFGHTTRRWNPKMSPYLFGVRNGIHIIDLEQTVPLLHQGLKAVRDIVAGGGRVLFVGTKRQASERLADAAKRCGQYYVNHRWLGGMLTNWKTISGSIRRLKEVEVRLIEEQAGLTKKELLNLTRERDKLERALGGIREMGGLPDVIFIIDTVKEHIAVEEAKNLNIPVVGILDSNADPANITFPIPGNDDATRSIDLYCNLVADAVLDGIQKELIATGTDIGADAEAKGEKLPEKSEAESKEPKAEEKKPEAEAKKAAEVESKEPKAEEKKPEAEAKKAAEAESKEPEAEEKKPEAEVKKAAEAESKESEAEEKKPEPEGEKAAEAESKEPESESKDAAPEVPAEVAAEAVEAAKADEKQPKA